MQFRSALAVCALVSLAAVPVSATSTNLYVADYGKGTLLQYTANLVGGQEVLTQATPTFTLQPPSGGSITEGINGTSDDILTIVKTSSGSYEIARYTDTGAFYNYVGNGTTTFQGVGNFVVTKDAQYMYVADETGNKLYKVSLATGNVVASVGLSGVHDVAILQDGSIIAENGAGGVEEYSANLTGGFQLIAQGSSSDVDTIGSTGTLQGHHQYGFAIDPSGNIWTVSDDRSGGPGSASGTSGTLYEFSPTGIFLGSWTPPQGSNLNVGTFGDSFGPDGNLYFANLGGVVLGDTAGNQVGEFNTSTDLFSTYLQGAASGTINSATGLSAPKYLNWQTDFSPSADPGFPTPEPSGVATAIAFAGLVGMMVVKSRRKTKQLS